MPSRVRQTSSASILPPLVRRITGLPPWRVAMPGPLVETGAEVARVWAVEMPDGELLGDGEGDGDGEGETSGDGDGTVTADCGGATGVMVSCVAAEVFRTC